MNYTARDAIRDLCHDRGWNYHCDWSVPARVVITGPEGLKITSEGLTELLACQKLREFLDPVFAHA